MKYFSQPDQSLNEPVRFGPDETSSLSSDSFVFGCLGLARARLAGGLCFRNRYVLVIGSANSRRQYGEIEAGFYYLSFARLLTVIPFIAVIAIATVTVVVAIIPVVALVALAIVGPLRASVFIIALTQISFDIDAIGCFLGDVATFIVALVIAPIATFAVIIPPFIALRAVFFLTATEIGEHAEIMVRELQIIFRLYPITVQLGVLRQLFIFFEHLRSVSARAIVDAILMIVAIAVIILRTIIAPAATAAGLPIIHIDEPVL
jgi:hypothetical protein